MIILNIWENKTCSKPPTRYNFSGSLDRIKATLMDGKFDTYSKNQKKKHHSPEITTNMFPKPNSFGQLGMFYWDVSIDYIWLYNVYFWWLIQLSKLVFSPQWKSTRLGPTSPGWTNLRSLIRVYFREKIPMENGWWKMGYPYDYGNLQMKISA